MMYFFLEVNPESIMVASWPSVIDAKKSLVKNKQERRKQWL